MIKGTRASPADVARYQKVQQNPVAAKASETMKGTRQTSSGPKGGQSIGPVVIPKDRAEIMSGTRRKNYAGSAKPSQAI